MKTMTTIAALGALAVLGLAVAQADDAALPAAPTDPRLEFLKGLAGTWEGAPHHEGAPPSRFEFRVTAGGHAVEEREMIGTPMEMLTVYHMRGRDLVGTHYCMLGNQPRVVAAPRVVDGGLSFGCDGTPGNAGSHDELHVHGWSIRREGDTLRYDGELVADGATAEKPSFVLTRVR